MLNLWFVNDVGQAVFCNLPLCESTHSWNIRVGKVIGSPFEFVSFYVGVGGTYANRRDEFDIYYDDDHALAISISDMNLNGQFMLRPYTFRAQTINPRPAPISLHTLQTTGIRVTADPEYCRLSISVDGQPGVFSVASQSVLPETFKTWTPYVSIKFDACSYTITSL